MRKGPSDDGGESPDPAMLIAAALAAVFGAYRLALCAYVYQDASSRGADAMSWLGLASVLGVIGVVVWLVARPRPALTFLPPYGYQPAPAQYPPGPYAPGTAFPPPPGYYQPPAYYPAPGQYPPAWPPMFPMPPTASLPPAGPPVPSFRPFSVHRMLATFFAAMAVTMFIELPIVFLLMAQEAGGTTDPAVLVERLLTPAFLLLSVAIQDAVLVAFTYVAMFWPGHLTLKHIGATLEANIPRGVAVGALAGLAMFALASGIGWLLERTGWFGNGEGIFQAGTPAGLALTLIATVAIAPPAEELFFRGYALPVLERRWGPAAGICLSAFIFALVHGSLVQLFPIFLAGVMLAALFRKYGIVPCITAHAVNNLMAVVVLYLGYG